MRVPAPRLVEVSAPIALARVPHWVSAPPRNHPAIKAAAKASPAPTVSWTVTSKGDTSIVPVAVAIVHQLHPALEQLHVAPFLGLLIIVAYI